MTDRPTPDTYALLRRSADTIKRLEEQLAKAQSSAHEPIAIIGIGCRFPGGANTPEKLWSLVEQGQDAVTEVPKERWDLDEVYDPDPDAPGKAYTRCGGFLDQVDSFDAAFFGITPREAVNLDPQQRLLLEVSWEALEHAGIAPSSISGTQTGVYVGLTTHDYAIMAAAAHDHLTADAYSASGSSHSIAAGRLSYFFGLHGPSFAVDTACSASIVSVHSAVQALRSGEVDLALAGGVTLTLSEFGAILTSRARMMSFVGRCQTFDADADGYVRGEGCAMIALKRKSDALRDGDRVLAYIRGSALNQDGRSTGMTAPNGQAQVKVLRAALRDAGVSPDDISYVEAHGTGTSLGDPIEIKALGEVFGKRSADAPLHVASIKTNIGHTEGAAGVAGIIKTVMALQHKQIPAHLHFNTPNPLIPWDNLPIAIPRQTIKWPGTKDVPRRAGVSSFGFSGTNGHLILEEALETQASTPAPAYSDPVLLAISARNEAALTDSATNLAEHLRQHPHISIREAAAELALGRSHLTARTALVVADRDDALEQLDAISAGHRPHKAAFGSVPGGEPPEVAFLFSGQGAQFAGMGRQLYESEPVFRAALDRCDALLADKLDKPLLSVIFGSDEAIDPSLLNDTAYSQPALFSLEWSLSELWRSWGIVPAAAVGHSVGEYTAACVAGVFSLEEGLTLIAERGRLMSSLPNGGGMAAVFAPEAELRDLLAKHEQYSSIAAVNGPNNTVISGRLDVLEHILSDLERHEISAQKLVVSHAFHSPLMDPILDQLERTASQIQYREPQISLVSNVTGEIADGSTYSAGYWRCHAREAVRFANAISTLHQDGFADIVELGPSTTLTGLAQQCPNADKANWFASLRKGTADQTQMLETAAKLYARGQTLNWANLFPDLSRPGARAALPTYPFQRVRYWRETAARTLRSTSSSGHPFMGEAIPGAITSIYGSIGLKSTPWLGDHRLFGVAPFPAAGLLDLALSAARTAEGHDNVALEDVHILEGLILPESDDLQLQIVFKPGKGGIKTLKIYSQIHQQNAGAEWRHNMSARVLINKSVHASTACPPAPASTQTIEPEQFYTLFEDLGVKYGPAFQPVRAIRHTDTEVWGELELSKDLNTRGFTMHPALLDGCAQLIASVMQAGDVYMPVSVQKFEVMADVPERVSCHVVDTPTGDPDLQRCSLTVFAPDGTQIAQVSDLEFRKVEKRALMQVVSRQATQDWLFDVHWQPVPLGDTNRSELPGRWLILSDRSGVGDRLVRKLTEMGADVDLVPQSDESRDQLPQILQKADEATDPLHAVVNLWPLDETDAPDVISLEKAHRDILVPALHLVQSLPSRPRLCFVTRGTQSVMGEAPNLASAPLNAFAGVVASEIPQAHCLRIDLDPSENPHEDDMLFQCLWTPDREDQVAIRGETRFAARLKSGETAAIAESEPVLLDVIERGTLDGLTFVPLMRAKPQHDEVEIRVAATGVNFRDVLNTLGMYPGEPGFLGNECAGIVTAVGDATTGFAVGDEVVAMTDRCFATYVIVRSTLVIKKPAHLTMAQAAATPVAYLTAEYALCQLGTVKPGDRVLIHAITGGVGSAAAHIARRQGARVFGTAGTAAKRAEALAQGAEYVADSRSLSFVDDIQAATGGEGVDFVLNSLANEFIPASLSLLRPSGHFVEIGKNDEWHSERVAQEFPGISYDQLYLGEVTATNNQLICGILERLFSQIEAGELPPPDVRAWPLEQAKEAFRFMAQGLHRGKIVLTQTRPSRIHRDASYLVTGGLKGIGLRTAQWLTEAGATNLVLLGRTEPDQITRSILDDLKGQSITVLVRSVDVTDQNAMAALIAEIERTMPPVRGVIHCAGVVEDAMLADQTSETLARVMAPKVRGGYLLDKLTSHMTLDFFVTYASGAGLLGAPGQANYAAANGFLDALSHARRARGLPALSVDWGSWSEIGMAARVDETHQRRWAEMGLAMIDPDAGVHMLEHALFGATSAQVAILPITRDRLPPDARPLLSDLVTPQGGQDTGVNDDADFIEVLATSPAEQHGDLIGDWLNATVIRVLALDEHTGSDRDRSLMEFGMDSLMAMELQNRIAAGLNIRITSTELLKGPTLNQLVSVALSELAEHLNGPSTEGWEEIDL
ncbi:type I polyketide synthase [Ruegeria sp. 2012CJ41-6]|uniref:Type I polyketide synthase n=1 Tax=Ruegeria spongiae TaxID=2942209 RepID=A0ABT0Q5R2_9RHOB|nr:type I polyketide synthase [Ruegeria spongiae]MCL6285142.1 type I polyketide synthase [Ruegeria spongiae]